MQVLKKITGVLLIFIGFIALVTPLTPGAWLMFVGLGLLGVSIEVSEDHRFAGWLRKLGVKLRKKEEKGPGG